VGHSRRRGRAPGITRSAPEPTLTSSQSNAVSSSGHASEPTDEVRETTTGGSGDDIQAAETFQSLGVDEQICLALTEAGISSPFPIQMMCIPLALGGQDLIGQAKTGTGKTLAFGVPVLQSLEGDRQAGRKPQGLVVVPTRELCVQVNQDLAVAGRLLGVSTLAVYGGRSYEPQIEALQRGVDVVVGTPGRLLDLHRQGKLALDDVRTLVLDEADEMLDMGFLPDVESIVSAVRSERQTMLFSATMPGQIVSLARRYMSNPMHVRAVDPSGDTATVDAIEQHAWRAHSMDKVELVARILQAEGRGLTMIFSRTKRTAQKVADDLVSRGFAAGAIHGDLGQGAREQALRAFRNGKIDVLVATDVAARGIDVEGVTHVINYTCPEDEKTYLHRIGRTGRAGADGVAITLVNWDEVPRWKLINSALGLPFVEPIETYSTSDHLYTGLNIPRGVSGRLAAADRARPGLAAEHIEDLGERPARRSAGEKRASNGDKPGRRRNQQRSRGGTGDEGRRRGGTAPTERREKAAEDRKHAPQPATDREAPTRPRRQRRRRRPNDS